MANSAVTFGLSGPLLSTPQTTAFKRPSWVSWSRTSEVVDSSARPRKNLNPLTRHIIAALVTRVRVGLQAAHKMHRHNPRSRPVSLSALRPLIAGCVRSRYAYVRPCSRRARPWSELSAAGSASTLRGRYQTEIGLRTSKGGTCAE
jgi:hypothetical protein